MPAGEIVGVAGVSGNGQTELVDVLCATPPADARARSPSPVTTSPRSTRSDGSRAGLGRITEDRRGSVVPQPEVEQNLVLEDLDRFRRLRVDPTAARVREHTPSA